MTWLRVLGLIAVVHFMGACAPVTAAEMDQPPSPRALYTPAAVPEGEEASPPRLSELHGFHFVVKQGGPFVVLDDAAGLDVWAGAPVPLPLADDDDVVAAWAPVVGGENASSLLDDVEREQVLYDANGVACFGELDDPALLYRGYHDHEQPDPMTALLDEITGGGGGPLLVAKVQVRGGDCSGAEWARPSRMPPPRVYAPDGDAAAPDEASWASTLARTARALPAYEQIQGSFDAWVAQGNEAEHVDAAGPSGKRWDESDDASAIARRYADVDGGDGVTTLSLFVAGGCGAFNASLWVAEPVRSGVTSTELSDVGSSARPLDVNDDGELEIFDGRTLVVSTGDGPQTFVLPDAYFVCPC